MSLTFPRRALTTALTAALVLVGVVLPVTTATAASTTTLSLSPSSGVNLTDSGVADLTTSLTCEPGEPDAGSPDFVRLAIIPRELTQRLSFADGTTVVPFGTAFPDAVAITTGAIPVNYDGTGTVPRVSGIFPVSTNDDARWSVPLSSALTAGTYSLVAACVRDEDSRLHQADTGDGVKAVRMAWATLKVDSNGGWSVSAPAVATTTVLTATLNSDNTATLTATVTADGAAVTAGTVEFYEGTALENNIHKIGQQDVSAAGTASYTTAPLGTTNGANGGAQHMFGAKFVPASGAYTASETGQGTSVTAVALTAATSTALTATLGADGKTATLAAAVTAGGKAVAEGKVQFKEGTTTLGDPVAVGSDGKAGYTTSALSTGTHTFSAVYQPASGSYATSSSSDATVTVAEASTTKGTSVTVAAVPSISTAGDLSFGLGAVVFQDGTAATTVQGTVQFTRDGTAVGSPVTVSNGQAAYRDAAVTFDTSYTYKAVFTPATGQDAKYTTATSDGVTVSAKSATTVTSGTTITPGTAYRIVAPDGTFTAGETVTGVIHSTPTTLGTTTATAAGGAVFTFTAPSGLEAGAHSVVLTGASGKTYTISVSVANAVTNKPASFATGWAGQVRDHPSSLAGLLATILLLAAAGVLGWNLFWRRRGRLSSRDS